MRKNKLLMLFPLVFLLTGCGKTEEPESEINNTNTGENTGETTGEHKFLSGWDKNETYHWHYCEEPGCEEMSNKEMHTFEWAVTQEATYESKGVKSYKCKVCGYVKEKQEIAKLEHTYITTSWSHDSSHHWHACANEGYEDKLFGVDLEEHIMTGGTPEIEPTYTQVGHTVSGKCSVCNAEVESIEIPVLNETNYVKTISKAKNVLTETWTLKDADVIKRDQYVVTKNIEYGWVVVDDYSSGKMVTSNYNYYEFNQAFPGIEISLDAKTKTTTINVTKPGGYTFNNASIIFPTGESLMGAKYIITGEPLIINAPEGLEEPGLLFSCSTNVNYMSSVTICNDLTINYSSGYTKANKNCGLSESILTVNAGAKLKINGFYNGIKASYTPITINGALEINTTNLAIVPSSTSKNRTIYFAEGSSVYFNGISQSAIKSTDTNTIKDSSVKQLQVIPA